MRQFAGDGPRAQGPGVVPYPIPHDGPVGKMLEATGRSPMRAAHLHFWVTAAGKCAVITHIFVRGDELLASDAVFGVRDSLITDFASSRPARRPRTAATSGTRPGRGPGFDIILAPEAAQTT